MPINKNKNPEEYLIKKKHDTRTSLYKKKILKNITNKKKKKRVFLIIRLFFIGLI